MNISKVFLLALMLVVLPGCTWWGGEEQTVIEDDQTGVATVEEPVEESKLSFYVNTGTIDQAKDKFNIARNLSLEWQADAYLILVSTKFIGSLDDKGVLDRFLYGSDLRPDLYFAVDIARDDLTNFTRSLIYREDYVLKSGVSPIPLKYWKVTAGRALEVADNMGGAQFRTDNPDYLVTQVLSFAGGNNLAWYVVYSAPGVNSMEVVVDAFSEQIIQ